MSRFEGLIILYIHTYFINVTNVTLGDTALSRLPLSPALPASRGACYLLLFVPYCLLVEVLAVENEATIALNMFF